MEQDKYLHTCPFCTSEAKIYINTYPPRQDDMDDLIMYQVQCTNPLCQASQCDQNTPQECVINWNKRR